jgi:hypothetical protein
MISNSRMQITLLSFYLKLHAVFLNYIRNEYLKKLTFINVCLRGRRFLKAKEIPHAAKLGVFEFW